MLWTSEKGSQNRILSRKGRGVDVEMDRRNNSRKRKGLNKGTETRKHGPDSGDDHKAVSDRALSWKKWARVMLNMILTL